MVVCAGDRRTVADVGDSAEFDSAMKNVEEFSQLANVFPPAAINLLVECFSLQLFSFISTFCVP